MAKNKLYFNTLAAALLYDWELSGQISDGKYENSRPYDHWKWICDTEIIVDSKSLNYTDRWIRKTYNLNEWSKYMKDGSNDWAWRVVKYVHFANCFESTQENYDKIVKNVSSSCVELIEDYGSYEEFVERYNRFPNYAKSEGFLDVFTEEVYNKYFSTPLDIKEFTKYHKLMKETVNRDKSDAEKDAEAAKEKAAAKEAEKEAKKAAKLAEAEAKRKALIEQASMKHTEVTTADTEDDIIAPKNGKTDIITLKYNLLKYAKEQLGVDIKELNVKLN